MKTFDIVIENTKIEFYISRVANEWCFLLPKDEVGYVYQKNSFMNILQRYIRDHGKEV